MPRSATDLNQRLHPLNRRSLGSHPPHIGSERDHSNDFQIRLEVSDVFCQLLRWNGRELLGNAGLLFCDAVGQGRTSATLSRTVVPFGYYSLFQQFAHFHRGDYLNFRYLSPLLKGPILPGCEYSNCRRWK